MSRISLLGGSYQSRSLIASAQPCINLFPEVTPPSAGPPTPVAHLPTPGTVTFANPNPGYMVRGLHRVSTTGDLIAYIGSEVYRIQSNGTVTHLGTGTGGTLLTVPAGMSDNGVVCVVCDYFAGYVINLTTWTFTHITDAAFYGSNRVCYLDGWFVFAKPNSNQFYLSPYMWDGVAAFDATYIASKTGGPDIIIGQEVINGNLWLFGLFTTEVWYDAGGSTFPFQRQPGVFVEHGCRGYAAIAPTDVEIFFLSQDRDGQAVVFKTEGYLVKRVSNHAVENSLQTSGVDLSQAIGYTYQQEGHTFYVLNVTAANLTWVYDLATDQWHQRSYNNGGISQAHRGVFHAFCFGTMNLIGDYANGRIYRMGLDLLTDDGAAIVRTRAFPHLVNDGKRLSYKSFILDVDVSQVPAGQTLSLWWSDDRGNSITSTPLTMTFEGTMTSLIVRRLGMARDRVFVVSWSFAYPTSLQGGWVEVEPAET